MERMGVSVSPNVVGAIIKGALEKPLFEIKANISARGGNPETYDMITGNDAKFINKKHVSRLIGVDYSNPEAYKLNWLEYGTAPRYTKQGWFRGEVVGFKMIRPVLDRSKTAVIKEVQQGILEEVQHLAKENGF